MVVIERPRWKRTRCDKDVGDFVVGVADASVLFPNFVVVTSADASLASKLSVPGFRVNAFNQFGFVNPDDYFGDDVVVVEKCVVRHYAQLTFPVPAVIVVTVKPPEGGAVVPVSPAPMVIV